MNFGKKGAVDSGQTSGIGLVKTKLTGGYWKLAWEQTKQNGNCWHDVASPHDVLNVLIHTVLLFWATAPIGDKVL